MLMTILLGVLLAQATPAITPSANPSASPTAAPLALSASEVNLNPAQQRVVTVTGASPPVTATLERKLVGVSVDQTATTITITASQATGSDVIHLTDANGATADINVRVAFNAGTIVAQATLKVTGTPADPAWVERQVEALVARLTLAQPGTQVQLGAAQPPVVPASPGTQTQFAVPVQITSPSGEYFDQTGSTLVTVVNVALSPFSPALLFYDDDPERIVQDGVLFRSTVTAENPVRLYYYHDDSTDPRHLAVVLTSNSQDPTSVQLVDAVAGPNIDVMHVGNTATRNFLFMKAHNEGVVADLAQDVPYLLHEVPMGAGELVAGTVDVRVLSGGPVTVSVVAVSPGVDPRTMLQSDPVPGDGHHRTGVFRLTGFGNDVLQYTAGAADDPKLVIGDRDPTLPSIDPQAAGHDFGDYGVLHDINVTFDNPTDAPSVAYLYFRPLAGVARASFLLDGNPIELGCVREPVPYEIAAYTLVPHQTSQALLQTMTDGGSFYPVEVGVTPTPPQPSAPPITAPDGCFPKP